MVVIFRRWRPGGNEGGDAGLDVLVAYDVARYNELLVVEEIDDTTR